MENCINNTACMLKKGAGKHIRKVTSFYLPLYGSLSLQVSCHQLDWLCKLSLTP